MLEIEAKIQIENRESFLSRCPDLQSKSKDHIVDIYFDQDQSLESKDHVLRLRKQNEKAYITHKGPLIEDQNLLVREEKEAEIASFHTIRAILESLGYTPTQITEKKRERFFLEECDAKIEVDHYPFIGYYVEIEGKRDDVLSLMQKFGYRMEDAIAKNCTELFYEYLEKTGIQLDKPALQFTFEDEAKLRAMPS